MLKKMLSSLLIFFVIITMTQTTKAAEDDTFSKRAVDMSEIRDLRYSIGSGRIRIVLDMTKEFEYDIKYMEGPSRIVIDMSNAWLNEKVPKSLELNSTAASQMRIAQYDKSKVRLVIETSAENNMFILNGGPAGKRFVIDIGADAEKPDFDKKVNEPEPVKVEKQDKEFIKIEPVEKKDKTDENQKSEKKSKKEDKKNKKNKYDKRNKDREKEVDAPFTDIDEKIKNLTNLQDIKIVIDPGHGGNDAGAIGPSGVMEKTVTLRVALELEKLLTAEGATVIMTRRTDTEVAARGRHATDIEELKARCEIANEEEADIFISIHADSFTNPASRGTTGYYFSEGSSDSKRLADCIRSALCAELQTPSRGTQPCNFYVVRNTDMPATLIELAFISNPIEEKLLNSKDGVQKAAQGIFDGIEDYFG